MSAREDDGLVEVISDGRTVWVNAADGSCIGRFSRFGIDVHRDFFSQMRGEPECLDCSHGRPDAGEWRRFVESMRLHHSVTIADRHMPAFITSSPQPRQDGAE